MAVARRLREDIHLWTDQVTIQEHNGEGASLIEAWKDAESVIVIDAVRSGAPPGAVQRFDASQRKLPAVFSSTSTHSFGLAEAIEMARTLKQLPPHTIVYGIEGENFAAGTELSAAVAHAVDDVVERIRTEA